MSLFATNRLTIRQFRETDLADFYLLNSHPEVMRYIRPVKTEQECADFLRENLRLYQAGSIIGRYHVAEKATNAFVGTFSVLMMPDRDAYHIGYALMPWAQGRGLAKELVYDGLRFVAERSEKPVIYAITEPINLSSIAVLEKSGFLHIEKLLQQEKLLDVYAIQKNTITKELL